MGRVLGFTCALAAPSRWRPALQPSARFVQRSPRLPRSAAQVGDELAARPWMRTRRLVVDPPVPRTPIFGRDLELDFRDLHGASMRLVL